MELDGGCCFIWLHGQNTRAVPRAEALFLKLTSPGNRACSSSMKLNSGCGDTKGDQRETPKKYMNSRKCEKSLHPPFHSLSNSFGVNCVMFARHHAFMGNSLRRLFLAASLRTRSAQNSKKRYL